MKLDPSSNFKWATTKNPGFVVSFCSWSPSFWVLLTEHMSEFSPPSCCSASTELQRKMTLQKLLWAFRVKGSLKVPSVHLVTLNRTGFLLIVCSGADCGTTASFRRQHEGVCLLPAVNVWNAWSCKCWSEAAGRLPLTAALCLWFCLSGSDSRAIQAFTVENTMWTFTHLTVGFTRVWNTWKYQYRDKKCLMSKNAANLEL